MLFNTNDNIKYKAAKMPRFAELQQGIAQSRYNFQQAAAPRLKHTPVAAKLA